MSLPALAPRGKLHFTSGSQRGHGAFTRRRGAEVSIRVMQDALQSRGEGELVIGPLQILPDEHLVRADGRVLMLSTRELRLLTELARHEDHIVSREDLFRLVWERPMRSRDRSVDVYVRKLRVKLEAALPDWRFIHTHFGFGYRLAAERAAEDGSQLDSKTS